MTSPLFAAPAGLDLTALPPGQPVRLGGAEGRHAAQVLRLRPGELLRLADGAGSLATCQVQRTDTGALDLTAVEVVAVSAPRPRLVVVQALPKGDRGEAAAATLTEVGVDVVVPWTAARCVTVWRGDRTAKALERWRATARESAKQSRRAWWPTVTEPAGTPDVASRLAASPLALVLHEAATVPLPQVLSAVDPGGVDEVVLVVGPEGGLTDDELATFAQAGARVVGLGPTVLRTSTAGTVAAGVVLAASGRWAVTSAP